MFVRQSVYNREIRRLEIFIKGQEASKNKSVHELREELRALKEGSNIKSIAVEAFKNERDRAKECLQNALMKISSLNAQLQEKDRLLNDRPPIDAGIAIGMIRSIGSITKMLIEVSRESDEAQTALHDLLTDVDFELLFVDRSI